jgi:hypothetical protein
VPLRHLKSSIKELLRGNVDMENKVALGCPPTAQVVLKKINVEIGTISLPTNFLSVDLVHAKKLNYSIVFYELCVFEKAGQILQRYLAMLSFEKIRRSDFPPDCITEAEKQEFLDRVNSEMRFEELLAGEKLTLDNMQPNKNLKEVAKRSQNAFIG